MHQVCIVQCAHLLSSSFLTFPSRDGRGPDCPPPCPQWPHPQARVPYATILRCSAIADGRKGQLLPLCTCEVQLTALYHIWHSVIPLPCLLCSLIVDSTQVGGRVWRLASLLLFGWNFKFKINTGLGCKLANLVEFLEMVSTDFLSVYITFLFSCTFWPPNCAATIQEITYTHCSFVPRPPPFAFTTIHS